MSSLASSGYRVRRARDLLTPIPPATIVVETRSNYRFGHKDHAQQMELEEELNVPQRCLHNRRCVMKWILVVLVGGVAPVPTDLVFEKLSDCLVAEEQLRKAYVEAFEARSQQTALNFDGYDRRRARDYYRSREMEARKVSNSGTCIPHSGTNQPITSLNNEPPAFAPSTPSGSQGR